MSVVVILIGVSLMVAITFLGLFIWSVSTGQFDDDYTPALRMLDDDNLNGDKNE
tara:strand:- start:1286 stop:1447 length:162 start_codon:yes stop_codon:yes gene_type:complete